MAAQVEGIMGLSTPMSVRPDFGHSLPTPMSAGSIQRSETASPSQISPQGSSNSGSASKRPPRKSTLTQQQKNQKRQRATQDQLTTLEVEFNKNPTPTATVRERIADEINMTERSVQIWFQNRRAKIKLIHKKSIETGDHFEAIPESMRTYLAMQAMESGKGYLGRGLLPYGSGGNMMMGGDQGGQGKVLIQYLTCHSLSIGKWMRVGQNKMDLLVFYSPDKCTMTYYINNEQSGYKIEYPFAFIKNIFLDSNESDPTKGGGIVIELNQKPHFHMDSSPDDGFRQVGDFTEDQQASNCMVHHLGGNPKVLSGQLAKLILLDSFMNRHHVAPFAPMHPIAVSAPSSPTNRPSSQPNFAQPHVGMFQEQSWAIGAIPPGMHHRGHKRQRSRSVPMAVDFSMLQTPMPSFFIQHPGETQAHPHDPSIYAPVPQQPNSLGPLNPNLRVDTSAGFGLDMRQYPVSATTAPSENDFAVGPNFFAAPDSAAAATSNFVTTPYSGTFLSPMVNPATMIPQSVSPVSFMSHGDPAIVDQSPPLSMLGRSASADLYTVHESAISEDGHSLNDMYSKHTLNLPMHPHSPAAFLDNAAAELDMNQLVSFDGVDAASLSPESIAPGMTLNE